MHVSTADGDPSPSSAASLQPAGTVLCENLEPIRAPDSAYRDEPVYVGNEQPTGQVRAWAQQQPGFEDLWLDRGRNGWVTVAFAGDVAQLQAEIEERFPDDGVVAVEVERTTAELRDVAERVAPVIVDVGLAHADLDPGHLVDLRHGVVSVDLGFLLEERLALLEPFAADPVCAQGAPASEYVPPGPQPTAGDGWRLLGADRTGENWRTGVATTPEQYAALWAQAGLTGRPPEVDLGHEIVLWFGSVESSSCPNRLDDVVVSGDLVHPDIVAPTESGGCTDDAGVHAYVVAVERAVLPVGPFMVQLDGSPSWASEPLEQTVVDVDLSAPGATAADDEIGPDEDFRPVYPPADTGSYVEVGLPVNYLLPVDPTCGVERLGELNGVQWLSEQGRDVPAAWQELVTDGALTVEATVEDLPATLTATAGGTTLTYRPLRSTDPATCG
ncbi:hypothetical protein [Georgenia subflava]|uniref:Uncharacterized protein n=1 Tax=Georgenia subflava TaxID=1622177 RepID=A0A6N7EJ11_9MICO|nr:hypothetical protein [Georgenia subflava]MPV38372.1 hypothetical protein [Georgenia subflava]